MKNAYVLVHHYGDDGNAPEGSILRNMTNTRFDELEKKGLVREATEAEAKEGYVPEIEKDVSTPPEVPADQVDREKQKPAPANKKAPEPSNKDA